MTKLDLKELCQSSDTKLWESYSMSIGRPIQEPTSCTLLFPKYYKNNEDIRISEQEARFVFSEVLCNKGIYYSIEAPTEKDYQLTGEKPLSASTDLTIYSNSFYRLFNVEFKSKGASPEAKEHFDIQKDIQKLLRENVNGLWFHLLKSVNNSTIPNLMQVFTNEIASVLESFKSDILKKSISFHICVLEHGFSLHKCIDFTNGGISEPRSIIEEMSIDIHVSRAEINNITNPNGWSIFRAN